MEKDILLKTQKYCEFYMSLRRVWRMFSEKLLYAEHLQPATFVMQSKKERITSCTLH